MSIGSVACILALALGILAPPLAAETQPGLMQAFEQGLRELGYIEGKKYRHELEGAFSTMAKERVSALLVLSDRVIAARFPDGLTAVIGTDRFQDGRGVTIRRTRLDRAPAP
jgi:hypothetical protein